MSDHLVHVEMYDGGMFCGFVPARLQPAVYQGEWHAEPEQIQRATCPDCLGKIFMLGDSAQLALNRMGMKIVAQNAPAEVEPS